MVLVLRRGWLKLPVHQPFEAKEVKTIVTVLIAARNEEQNIAATIEAILAQDYPRNLVELIVVDDHSTDNTSAIIASYAEKGVRLIQLNEPQKLNSYKKKAITKAIAVAKGELMVATDADCYMGEHWLRAIVTLYEEKKFKLISSPVIYYKEKSYFERLQTLEFLYLIGLGGASIGINKASTCNGANLAYRRDVFYELGGFQGIDDLASGDDELFLHKVAERYPSSIGFCKAREAVVYTEAKENVREFIRQRKRWASKSTRYKNKGVVLLGIVIWLFNLLILLSGLFSLFQPSFAYVFFVALSAKILIELCFMVPLTRFADRKKLLWNLPLLSVIHVCYIVYIGIAGNTGKYYWKGRMVK
ncbi:glycosyltransferase [Olivibacter sp. SDN3]|nr:glycosyltransferase [Olivibacter sp. SDN3]